MAKCAELDVPIYLHPTVPMIKEFWTYGLALAGPSFGFGVETSLAMFRLVLSGVFDAYPSLKVVLGHYGEGLPFILDRIDFAANFAHVAADSGASSAEAEAERVPAREHVGRRAATTCPAPFLLLERPGQGTRGLRQRLPVWEDRRVPAFLEGRGLSDVEKEMLY